MTLAILTLFPSQLFGTATFVNNAALFAHLLTLAEAAFLPVQTVKSFQASFVLQPIPKSITSKADLNGGNSLGLNPDDGDLVCELSLPKSLNGPMIIRC